MAMVVEQATLRPQAAGAAGPAKQVRRRSGAGQVEEQATTRPNLRLVPAGADVAASQRAIPRRGRAGNLVLLATAVATVAAVVFGLVLVNIALAQSSFRLATIQGQVAEQEARYRRLRFEVARAESPERISKAASELGLVPPQEQRYIPGSALARGAPSTGVDTGLAAAKTPRSSRDLQ